MKIKIHFVLASLALVLFAACTPAPSLTQMNGKTMGTTYSVKIYGSKKIDKQNLHQSIEEALKKVNAQMSTYIPGSEIDRLNKKYQNQPYIISQWFGEVLNYSLNLAKDTGGVFDPTLGPLVNLWGFGPGGSRKIPEDQKIKEIREYVGHQKLSIERRDNDWAVTKTDPRVSVDLSATAKGFGVDKVAELLDQKDHHNYLVDIGGELRAKGSKGHMPWTVAIENPDQQQPGVVLAFPLQNMSIATSGSYRNFFEQGGKKYSHTIDSKTGQPIQHNLVSVTILHPECMKADGLATALHAMGPDAGWEYALKNKIAAYFISVTKNSHDPSDTSLTVIKKSTPDFENQLKTP